MNTSGMLVKRVQDLECGIDGDERDLLVSWDDEEPFVIFHMRGSRCVGQSEPRRDQYNSDISADNNNKNHHAKPSLQSSIDKIK